MTSMVRTQGQKSGYFFVPLTADSLHSVANFEVEMEDQIRKNGRGGHSTALQLAHPFQRREVDETTFALSSSTYTSGSMKSLKLVTLGFPSIFVWWMKPRVAIKKVSALGCCKRQKLRTVKLLASLARFCWTRTL